MKKICVSFCIGLILSSCGGVNSKIQSYKEALQEDNIEKAASILSSLSTENLTEDQRIQIKGIHQEYFSHAVDAYIEKFAELMNEGKLEEAAEMMEGVEESLLTIPQATKIAEITMSASTNVISSFGNIMQEANGMIQKAGNVMNDAVEMMDETIESYSDYGD